MSTKTVSKTASKKPTGGKLKSLLRDKPAKAAPQKSGPNLLRKYRQISWPGCIMVEEKVNPRLIRSFYARDSYPLHWFELHIGQLIYALPASESGFVGLISVVNKAHAKKLESLQGGSYTFCSVLKMGERIADQEGNDFEQEPGGIEYSVNNLLEKANVKIEALDSFIKEIEGTDSIYPWLKEGMLSIANEELNKISAVWQALDQDYYNKILHTPAKDSASVNEIIESTLTPDQIKFRVNNLRAQAIGVLNKYINSESEAQDVIYTNAYHLLNDVGENGSFDYQLFIRDIMNFLFIPENGTAFYKMSGNSANKTIEILQALYGFFESCSKEVCTAELTRTQIADYSYLMNYKQLLRTYNYYKSE
jgi:hypothetical protein